MNVSRPQAPWRVLALLLTLFGATGAAACDNHVNGELWVGRDRFIGGADAAVLLCGKYFTGARLGVSYFMDDEHVYKGVTGSLRLQAGHYVMPYVGFGGLLGEAERTVSASADSLDNDADGVVDEYDEETTRYDFGVFAYPEAGIALCLGGVGLTFSAKRYYGVEFNGDLIFGAGISVCARDERDEEGPDERLTFREEPGMADALAPELACDPETQVRMCRTGTRDCRCEPASIDACLASGLCKEPYSYSGRAAAREPETLLQPSD